MLRWHGLRACRLLTRLVLRLRRLRLLLLRLGLVLLFTLPGSLGLLLIGILFLVLSLLWLLFLLLHPVQGQLQIMFGIVVSGVQPQCLDIGLGRIPEVAHVVERISGVVPPVGLQSFVSLAYRLAQSAKSLIVLILFDESIAQVIGQFRAAGHVRLRFQICLLCFLVFALREKLISLFVFGAGAFRGGGRRDRQQKCCRYKCRKSEPASEA